MTSLFTADLPVTYMRKRKAIDIARINREGDDQQWDYQPVELMLGYAVAVYDETGHFLGYL